MRAKLVARRFSCCAQTEELHRQENNWLPFADPPKAVHTKQKSVQGQQQHFCAERDGMVSVDKVSARVRPGRRPCWDYSSVSWYWKELVV